jgi:hypothetical protein
MVWARPKVAPVPEWHLAAGLVVEQPSFEVLCGDELVGPVDLRYDTHEPDPACSKCMREVCRVAREALAEFDALSESAAAADDDRIALTSNAEHAMQTMYQKAAPAAASTAKAALHGIQARTPEGMEQALGAMTEIGKWLSQVCPPT